MAERTDIPVHVRPRTGVLALSVLAAVGASLAATIVEPALLIGLVVALVLLVLD